MYFGRRRKQSFLDLLKGEGYYLYILKGEVTRKKGLQSTCGKLWRDAP